MKANTIQQEILVLIRTSLSKRQWAAKKEDESANRSLSPAEELEKVCWAGLLYELLPEIVPFPGKNCNNYIWEIRAEKNFIRIMMGPCPQPIFQNTSLDPHLFLQNSLMN